MSVETEAALQKYTTLAREGKQSHVSIPGSMDYLGINGEDGPYTLRINAPRFDELLKREFRFSTQQLDKVRVYVIGEHPPKRPHKFTKEQRKLFFDPVYYKGEDSFAAIYEDDNGTQHIMIYAFNVWKHLNREKTLVVRQAKRKNKTEKSWKELEKRTELFAINPRMKSYLEVAPAERVEKFMGRILPTKGRNAFRQHLIHETSHAFQYKVVWEKLAKKLTEKLMDLFLETQADSENVRAARKPEWFDVVDFKINPPLNPPAESNLPQAA